MNEQCMSDNKVCGNCKYWITSDNIMRRYGEGVGICIIGASSIMACDRMGCLVHSEKEEVEE